MVSDVLFEPARLRLARELMEWTQADLARRVGVTAAAVSQFESGATTPGRDVTRRLGELLDVPLAFFELALVETHEGFFRSLRRTSMTHRRRARALAQIAHDVVVAGSNGSTSSASVPFVPITDLHASRLTLEAAAAAVRNRWGLADGPIPNVVATLEAHGVAVIRLPLDTADVDAFSLPFHDQPIIVLGSDKNDRGRSRFDAAHELGHLVMHGDQVWGLKEIEHQAHAFAAAFLMPEADIYDELPSRSDWPTFFGLKQKWQVSLAALLMRARVLGRMQEPQYLSAVKEASARGWRRVEPLPLGRPEQPQLLASLLASPRAQRASANLPPNIIGALADATSG
jgi:Zn-dependent peptidase ImmA (M78 family)/transcriptional regulator with XRE-family HTH domain